MTGTVSELWARMARRVVQIRSDYVIAAMDVVLCLTAFISALVLRFEGRVPGAFWNRFWNFMPFVGLIVLISNAVCGLYGKVWRHASIHEARRLLASGSLMVSSLLVLETTTRRLPYSVVAIGVMGTVALMGLVRFQSRLFSFQRLDSPNGLRVVVIGSRDLAGSVVRDMMANPRSGFRPVAVVDDDPNLTGRSLGGVEVAGGLDDLAGVVERFGAHLAVLAIPNPSHEVLGRAAEGAERAGVPLKIMPPMSDSMRLGVSLRDLRDLRIEDLLGRDQVTTDLTPVREMLTGQTVLVTGAGGSIGSEIARQVLAAEPRKLVLVDHDETHLHDVAAELGPSATLVLADVRNRRQMHAVFSTHRPTVVFHAAAHKHVPLLEDHPTEAVHTNVLGTSNVIDAAIAVDVDRFVLISTDKAVHPTSVMGASKRICEQILMTRAPRHAAFCAVRFGNVVGSRGSVVPTFMKQIEAGGPVTLTDARMTRYFMSIQEAVHLVLHAATLATSSASGGNIFMLDMGEPVRILDLAERMIRLSGRIPGQDIEVRIVGVRPGEKLQEELSTLEESSSPTAHPSITRLDTVAADADVLEQGVLMLEHHVDELNDARCAQVLHRLAIDHSTTGT